MNYKENNIENINNEEIRLVCFAIKGITKRYPNNNKIYASLISTFFLSKHNEKILLDEFHKLPSIGKYDVYDILEQLEKLNIIRIETGARGSRYLFINENELNSSINYLKDHSYVAVEGNINKLTYQGDESSL